MSLELLVARVVESTTLVTTLGGDLAYSPEDIAQQRYRRAYVRAAFALVEGTVFSLKRILLEAVQVFDGSLDAGERAMLEEQEYQLQNDGTVRTKRAFLRVADNIRFTLGLGPKVFGIPVVVDYSGRGWAGLKVGIQVRNRLVHPKSPSDLEVSDEELSSVAAGVEWFKKSSVDFMLAAREAAVRKKGSLKSGAA
jgi:hypothetical protein